MIPGTQMTISELGGTTVESPFSLTRVRKRCRMADKGPKKMPLDATRRYSRFSSSQAPLPVDPTLVRTAISLI